MSAAKLYVRDLVTIPTAYLSNEIVFDDGTSAGWQSTICRRCNSRLRVHEWALYVIPQPGVEAVLDCSVDPR